MINSFKSLPHELEEAALIDGLGYWGILRRIIVPLSTAAIATVGLYYAVFFWNDWFNSLIYLNKEQYPVMLFLRNIVNGTAMVGDGAGSADKSSLGIAIKSAVIIVSTLHHHPVSLPAKILRQGPYCRRRQGLMPAAQQAGLYTCQMRGIVYGKTGSYFNRAAEPGNQPY